MSKKKWSNIKAMEQNSIYPRLKCAITRLKVGEMSSVQFCQIRMHTNAAR